MAESVTPLIAHHKRGTIISGKRMRSAAMSTPSVAATVGSGAGPPASLACTGDETQALENGDAINGTGVFGGGNLVNSTSGVVLDLANEDTTFDPTGDALGQLSPGLKPAPSDLRPQTGNGYTGVISPGGHPVANPDFANRGAFEPGGEVWTDGWTALSLGGLN